MNKSKNSDVGFAFSVLLLCTPLGLALLFLFFAFAGIALFIFLIGLACYYLFFRKPTIQTEENQEDLE